MKLNGYMLKFGYAANAIDMANPGSDYAAWAQLDSVTGINRAVNIATGAPIPAA